MIEPVAPFGPIGSETARLGHDPATGRFLPGNMAAVVAGQHSRAFWEAADETRRSFVEAVLRDHGHTRDDAPSALLAAADGTAQSVLLRDSAFHRVIESGGPVALRGRRRAAFNVWREASDRAERYLRLLGLERRCRPVTDPLAAVRMAVAEANRE